MLAQPQGKRAIPVSPGNRPATVSRCVQARTLHLRNPYPQAPCDSPALGMRVKRRTRRPAHRIPPAAGSATRGSGAANRAAPAHTRTQPPNATLPPATPERVYLMNPEKSNPDSSRHQVWPRIVAWVLRPIHGPSPTEGGPSGNNSTTLTRKGRKERKGKHGVVSSQTTLLALRCSFFALFAFFAVQPLLVRPAMPRLGTASRPGGRCAVAGFVLRSRHSRAGLPGRSSPRRGEPVSARLRGPAAAAPWQASSAARNARVRTKPGGRYWT